MRDRAMPPAVALNRRTFLAAGAGGLLVLSMPRLALARPSLEEAIRGFTGGGAVKDGRVKLDIPEIVENGNAVGVTVNVDSPMSPTDRVRRIALFNEKNPEAGVAVFRLGAQAGWARVSTRIRLAMSQTVVAVAEMSDGSFWSSKASVVVTLAACIEDLG